MRATGPRGGAFAGPDTNSQTIETLVSCGWCGCTPLLCVSVLLYSLERAVSHGRRSRKTNMQRSGDVAFRCGPIPPFLTARCSFPGTLRSQLCVPEQRITRKRSSNFVDLWNMAYGLHPREEVDHDRAGLPALGWPKQRLGNLKRMTTRPLSHWSSPGGQSAKQLTLPMTTLCESGCVLRP